jgi:hypothetical protein
MSSRSLARLWKSAFVEIDEIWDALNVVAIGDSHLLFSLFEPRRDRIAPTELRRGSVPNKEIAFIQPAAFFKTPFQNFFVRSALLYTLNQIAMMHAQKIAADAVGGFQPAEVLSIVFVKLAAQMQADFIQHAREIHHALGHLFWAFGINTHRRMNPIILGYAIIGLCFLYDAAKATRGRVRTPKVPRCVTKQDSLFIDFARSALECDASPHRFLQARDFPGKISVRPDTPGLLHSATR